MCTWVQAYSILMAALASDKATTNDESVHGAGGPLAYPTANITPAQALKYD